MAIYRFIFYSIISLALIWGGHLLKPDLSGEFLVSWQLWRDPILAGMICGLGAALLGVYILLNRIVFVSLALAQGAGLGIFLLFWICALLGNHVDHTSFPFLMGLGCALLMMGIFVWLRRFKSFSEESLIGLLYIISSGLILLVGDRITQGKHDIDNLLFGNAVAVTPQDLKLISIVMGAVFIFHLLFQKRFIFISADSTFMHTKGVKVKFWMLLLYFLLTIGITASLKTLGALPVFGLMVIPPFIGLKNARSLGSAFSISVFIGLILPAIGYYYSFLFSFPTGASLIFVSLFYLLASWIEGWTRLGYPPGRTTKSTTSSPASTN